MSNMDVYSAGARYERKAIVARLRRRIRYYDAEEKCFSSEVLRIELEWQLARQKRYDAKPGGLGKKK